MTSVWWGDYGAGMVLSEEEARELLESAEGFVLQLANHLRGATEGAP